jgi:hypothetical protein
MFRTLMVGAVACAALGSVPASAQREDGLNLFKRGNFKGAPVIVTGPRQAIDPALTVRSVTIPPGTRWELCSGSTFSGCREYSESQPAMVMTVRSVRPLAPILSATGSTPPGATAGGQSLRGWSSEYFVSPDVNGARVLVQEGTGEGTKVRAHEFCRSHGWRSSAYQRLQTVGQVSYLADVLCVDNGN